MDTAQTAPVNHISLCAGYAGIDLGLRRVIRGLRTIALSEIEAFACANLVAKMEAGLLDAAPIWSNLKTFPWSSFRGRVGILSGGFPCQPFSAAGKRGGDEDPRHLFPYILRGIDECHPDLVFLENVEGIISAKLAGTDWRDPAGTPVLLHVLRELERVGYRATAGVFSSAEIGASHQRKRVFILAQRMANPLHDGHPTAERPSGARPSENQGWLRQPERVGSPQRNVLLRPKPPGPDQWWWEQNRVLGDTQQSRLEGSAGEGFDRKGRTCEELTSRCLSVENAVNQGERRGASQCRGDDCGRSHCQAPLPSGRSGDRETDLCSSQPSLGRDTDGSACRLDYAQLSTTVDNRTDELRLLGNGVDPDVVAKAFVTLYNQLNP